MQLLAFNALELPDQAALDAAAKEYQTYAGQGAARPGQANGGGSSSLSEALGATGGVVGGLLLLSLLLWRYGPCRRAPWRRAIPRGHPHLSEWSTMLETSDAPLEGTKAAADVAMAELAPANTDEAERERFTAVD